MDQRDCRCFALFYSALGAVHYHKKIRELQGFRAYNTHLSFERGEQMHKFMN